MHLIIFEHPHISLFLPLRSEEPQGGADIPMALAFPQIYWRISGFKDILSLKYIGECIVVEKYEMSNVLHSGSVVISSQSFKPSKPTIHGMRGIVCLVELALRAFLTKDKSADKISHHCFWLPPPPPPLWLLLSREIA